MPRSSKSVAAVAGALAKAQAKLVNPEKSLTATICIDRRGETERSFRYPRRYGPHHVTTLDRIKSLPGIQTSWIGSEPSPVDPRDAARFARDDTTPIPRTYRYYGHRQNPVSRELSFRKHRRENPAQPTLQPSSYASILPSPRDLFPSPIDKSILTISEPKRLRDKTHLRFVVSQPCLVCGRRPSDPHHLRFAQPRALGLKVSDEFTVPLCRGHHRQLHQAGKEPAWWEDLDINALEIANGLWEESHLKSPSLMIDAKLSGTNCSPLLTMRMSTASLGSFEATMLLRSEIARASNESKARSASLILL